jgi:hypothetical protein
MPDAGAVVLCKSCAYDVAAVVSRDRYARCPECGDGSPVAQLKPWPGPVTFAWQLFRVQAASLGVVVVLALTAWIDSRLGGRTVGPAAACLAVPAALGTLLLLVCWPVAQAEIMAADYCPDRRRIPVVIGLVVLGWVGGAALAAVAWGLGAAAVLFTP